jgi:PAS domain S-box-containing protein
MPDGTVVDEGGHVIALAEHEDVSAQRRIAAELHESSDELRLALAAGRLGVLRWYRATDEVSVDATAESLLGLTPGSFGGDLASWAALLHPDDRDRVLTMLSEAVEQRTTYDLEYRVVWPDGSVHWLGGRGQVTLDDAGEVTGRIGCMADVTDRRNADEQLARLLAAERDARGRAETAAARLRSLQEVTAQLARALDPQAVSEAVLHEGVAALGGLTGSILLVAPDGANVDIVHEVGYGDDVKARWTSFPVDAELPASDAIRTGQMVLLASSAERDGRYPVFRHTAVVGSEAVAVVPLLDEDGTAFGAMVVGFGEERSFPDDERRLLASLADQCATALRRVSLYTRAREAAAAERNARLAAERSQDRLAFLADASSELASSTLDLEVTLSRVVELAVPRLGDWCAIHLVDERGELRPLTVAHPDPANADLARRLGLIGADPRGGLAEVARTGQARITRRIPEEVLVRIARDEGHLELLRRARLRGSAILPLRARHKVVGTLALATQGERELDDDDLTLAEELARRAGTAIDNARLFAERSRVARSLQASLLPAGLPTVPGLQLGARYSPAGEGVEVGGDFYDAFSVDGRCLLVVGDVRGKGVDAAAVTGMARHTIRSIAMSEGRPSAILSHLNRVLLAAEAERTLALLALSEQLWQLTEPRFCTVAVVAVEATPAGARVVVCSGGHPLPLLARAEGTVETVGRPGDLVGAVADIELHDVEAWLGPGDALVCFTDGITERHEGKRFFDDRGIAEALSATLGQSAGSIATQVERAARGFVEGPPHDDMAVLVVRVPA